MKMLATPLGWLLLCLPALAAGQPEGGLPETDARCHAPATLDTPRTFPPPGSLADWQARRQAIREQILVSAGLWPLPEKCPLNAHVFGRTEHGDFSVEKVYIQTWPGFYLGGNLYRPLGKGPGPFPGVLNPHGHWNQGRLEDGAVGSIPARCISFARMGMVAFAYDMVGYNDTQFADAEKTTGYAYHRRFGTNQADLLWSVNLMGLQTWNSIRALDFLAALPDVDPRRLGATGASGGGTQTFMLGAIDDRLAALAPTVMVSHTMQGGCSCENMPGLRIDYSNMEIAAVPAPKPQIFVAATGDWTRAFLTVEGPALDRVYRLFQAPSQVRYTVLNFNHNYNQSTREQVYAFFGQHLLHHPDPLSLKERPYPAATNLDLRVFGEVPRPSDTRSMAQLAAQLKAQAAAQWEALIPTNKASLARFKSALDPAWRHTLQIAATPGNPLAITQKTEPHDNYTITELHLGRAGAGDRILAAFLAPARKPKALVVLAHPEGKAAFLDAAHQPQGLAKALLNANCSVLAVDTFLTGAAANPALAQQRAGQVNLFFTTYNRTDTQERVQDLITAGAYARRLAPKGVPVAACGFGAAGLWTLLAAPAFDAVAADTDGLDPEADLSLLRPDLFVPGIRRVGGFQGVAMLAAPHPLLLHHTGGVFPADRLTALYQRLGAKNKLQVQTVSLPEASIAEWIARQ